MAIRVAHCFKSKWNPVDDTEEEVIDFFERRPENGGKVFHRKFRPNRNWCYFEQCSTIRSSTVTVVQTGCLHCFPSKENLVNPINLGPASTQQGNGSQQPPIHFHSNRDLCHERIQIDQRQFGTNDLKIRLWLESAQKHRDGRQFVAYDLLIPNLK